MEGAIHGSRGRVYRDRSSLSPSIFPPLANGGFPPFMPAQFSLSSCVYEIARNAFSASRERERERGREGKSSGLYISGAVQRAGGRGKKRSGTTVTAKGETSSFKKQDIFFSLGVSRPSPSPSATSCLLWLFTGGVHCLHCSRTLHEPLLEGHFHAFSYWKGEREYLLDTQGICRRVGSTPHTHSGADSSAA